MSLESIIMAKLIQSRKETAMGVNRIFRRNASRIHLTAKRVGHKIERVFFFFDNERMFRPKTCWLDLRPRDKNGVLQGYCSRMAKLYSLGRHITKAERREALHA